MSRRERRDADWTVRYSWLHHFLIRNGGRDVRVFKCTARSVYNTFGVRRGGQTRASIDKRRRHAKRHGKRK